MGRKCTYDDSHLRKVVSHPQNFPYKAQILRIFEKYGYHNEEVAFKVSKIRKWDDDSQQARYDRLANIVSLIPYLSSSDDCKKIVDTPLSKDGVKEFISASAEYYLSRELGKWHSENFKRLFSFLREKNAFDGPGKPILQKDGTMVIYSGGVLRRISKAEYDAYIADLKAGRMGTSPFSEDEWVFLMDTFMVEQNGVAYSDYTQIAAGAFREAMERAYGYIVENMGSIRKDDELMARAPGFTITRLVDTFLSYRISVILAQNSVSFSQIRKQLQEAVDASFFYHRLPELLKEYQDWEILHDDEHVSYIGKVKNALIQWRGDEFSHISNYIVAQYLYFVITGELIAHEGNVPMPIACVIDEVMRLFNYLENVDWESALREKKDQQGFALTPNRIDSEIRKRRLDCVKRFFLVDPITKEYRRLR